MKTNITIYTCDYCGVEAESSDFKTRTESGHAKVSVIGSEGSMSFQGDWGGGSYKIEEDACFRCSKKIRKMLAELKEPKE